MSRGFLVVLTVTLLATFGGARSQEYAIDQPDPRFDLAALQGICSYVRARDSGRIDQRINQAAGVETSDTDEEAREKTALLFRERMPLCSGFNLSRGLITKYAVASTNYDFLYSAAYVWDVDLNAVDGSGETLLDYVLREVSKREHWRAMPEPSAQQGIATFDGYRDLIIRAGGRTRAQLDAGEACRPSTRCRQGRPGSIYR